MNAITPKAGTAGCACAFMRGSWGGRACSRMGREVRMCVHAGAVRCECAFTQGSWGGRVSSRRDHGVRMCVHVGLALGVGWQQHSWLGQVASSNTAAQEQLAQAGAAAAGCSQQYSWAAHRVLWAQGASPLRPPAGKQLPAACSPPAAHGGFMRACSRQAAPPHLRAVAVQPRLKRSHQQHLDPVGGRPEAQFGHRPHGEEQRLRLEIKRLRGGTAGSVAGGRLGAGCHGGDGNHGHAGREGACGSNCAGGVGHRPCSCRCCKSAGAAGGEQQGGTHRAAGSPLPLQAPPLTPLGVQAPCMVPYTTRTRPARRQRGLLEHGICMVWDVLSGTWSGTW